MRFLLLTALVALSTASASGQRLMVHGGPIYTVDAAMPVAQAFAVEDGRFVAVGTEAEVLAGRSDWPRWTSTGGPSRRA